MSVSLACCFLHLFASLSPSASSRHLWAGLSLSLLPSYPVVRAAISPAASSGRHLSLHEEKNLFLTMAAERDVPPREVPELAHGPLRAPALPDLDINQTALTETRTIRSWSL